MAKTIFTMKVKCTSATKNANGAVIQLSRNMETNDKGQVLSREVVNCILLDKKVADSLETIDSKQNGKEYTLTLTEN